MVSLSLALFVSVPLSASAENEFGRSGPYVRGGVAAAFDLTSLLGDFVDTGVGLGLAGGYRMNKWLAVEAQYDWLGKTDLGGGGTTAAQVKRWDATANVRASLSGRFQPYAVIGVGYGHYGLDSTSTNDSLSLGGFVARFGGGLDIYITNHIAVYADAAYMMTTGDIDPFDYAILGAGAMYRF